MANKQENINNEGNTNPKLNEAVYNQMDWKCMNLSALNDSENVQLNDTFCSSVSLKTA